MAITLTRGVGQGPSTITTAGSVSRSQKLISNFGHRAYDDDRREPLVKPAANDTSRAVNSDRVFDGGSAKLHHYKAAHAGTATGSCVLDSSFPSEASSSALSRVAPAAPRIVLCESRVNFQSSRPQGRSLPTVAAMPRPRHLSSLG